ncbi:uncharacterized protein EAE98_011646 [Botrytis deweyae]|uniref:Single-strand DNA deaminase toxin A-like C-terminal domain-containing protein n=1 Tax=Botrytis deweyae TaxID=2478750 RepID=A0ABQ7I546_9HELO|nr:uncharacterized protein EAE98_011646 [Botrytis deweyae]KAF7913095.1 hypothetical protein EAE98_011646 [Botrytis deweyae]
MMRGNTFQCNLRNYLTLLAILKNPRNPNDQLDFEERTGNASVKKITRKSRAKMEPAKEQKLCLLNGKNVRGTVPDDNTETNGDINLEDNTELSDFKTHGSESAVDEDTGHEAIAEKGKGKQQRSDSGVELDLSGLQIDDEPNEREKSFGELWIELAQSNEPITVPNNDFSELDKIFEVLNSSIEESRNIDPRKVDAVDNSRQRNALRASIMKAALWGNSNIRRISKTPIADEKDVQEERKSINTSTQTANLETPTQPPCTEEIYFTPRERSPSCYQELFIQRTYPLSRFEEYKTIAHISFGHNSDIPSKSATSGWEDWTEKVEHLCHNIGHHLASDKNDRGKSGSFNACHAEKKLVAYYFAQCLHRLPASIDENHHLFRCKLREVAPRGVYIVVTKDVCEDCKAFIMKVKTHYQLHDHFHVQARIKYTRDEYLEGTRV